MSKTVRSLSNSLYTPVHNNVNKRLASDPTTDNDPAYPKQLFPSIKQCPKCYIPSKTKVEDLDSEFGEELRARVVTARRAAQLAASSSGGVAGREPAPVRSSVPEPEPVLA